MSPLWATILKAAEVFSPCFLLPSQTGTQIWLQPRLQQGMTEPQDGGNMCS